jgi:Polyketide cyclase / dehydrase and lipid transport
MWSREFRRRSPLPAEAIWPVIADVANWPSVDHQIDWVRIDRPAAPGVAFQLKPKGGPTLSMTIGRFEPPCRYSDVCRMPLARMETLHTLEPGAETVVQVRIEITGPLAGLWGLVVGRRHFAGLPAQTDRILERAAAANAASLSRGSASAPAHP